MNRIYDIAVWLPVAVLWLTLFAVAAVIAVAAFVAEAILAPPRQRQPRTWHPRPHVGRNVDVKG